MKVAHLISSYFPSMGGAQACVHHIAKKAVRQLREWAFNNLKLEKILIKVAKCNAGSCKVAQSITGLPPRDDSLTVRDKVYEAWVYTVLPTAGD